MGEGAVLLRLREESRGGDALVRCPSEALAAPFRFLGGESGVAGVDGAELSPLLFPLRSDRAADARGDLLLRFITTAGAPDGAVAVAVAAAAAATAGGGDFITAGFFARFESVGACAHTGALAAGSTSGAAVVTAPLSADFIAAAVRCAGVYVSSPS